MSIDVEKLNRVIEELRSDVGEGLVGTDIWAAKDARSLASYKTQPKAAALFNEVTRVLEIILKGSEFPDLGDYYLVNLKNDIVVVIVIAGDYRQSLMVNLAKTTMGVLMSVALPKLLNGLSEATAK